MTKVQIRAANAHKSKQRIAAEEYHLLKRIKNVKKAKKIAAEMR